MNTPQNNFNHVKRTDDLYYNLFEGCIRFKRQKNKEIDCEQFYNNIKSSADLICDNSNNKKYIDIKKNY